MKKSILAAALVLTMLLTCAFTALAVDETDALSGDLTVTTFFNEKTNALPLKSGDSYTIKFHEKSNGSQNWENYVLAVTGAIGDAYTGAPEEILIIRADNWGWGGGMSDFALPDAAEGNKLAFETDIVWENWVAMAQAGFDVEITISRDGDTITYSALLGSYTDKLTATSGKALPETAYVFLTGENCVLTGISSVKNGAEPGAAEPGTTEPGTTEPGATEPGTTEPGKADDPTDEAGKADDPTPTEPEPTVPDDDVPKTGDDSSLGLWIALAVLSAAGAAAVAVKELPLFGRKK